LSIRVGFVGINFEVELATDGEFETPFVKNDCVSKLVFVGKTVGGLVAGIESANSNLAVFSSIFAVLNCVVVGAILAVFSSIVDVELIGYAVLNLPLCVVVCANLVVLRFFRVNVTVGRFDLVVLSRVDVVAEGTFEILVCALFRVLESEVVVKALNLLACEFNVVLSIRPVSVGIFEVDCPEED
jgi:hypothetical protein